MFGNKPVSDDAQVVPQFKDTAPPLNLIKAEELEKQFTRDINKSPGK